MSNEFLWVEEYRPQKIDDCILPGRLKEILKNCIKQKQIPNFLFVGPAGCGKTTAAKALCTELGINFMFINSSEERGIDVLRNKVINYASTISLTGGQKVIILDEADYLTPESQAALRGIMEQFSSNCTFILTCNFKSKLIEALQSRCSTLDFTLQKKERAEMALSFYKRMVFILNTEKISFDKDVLVKITEKYFPDYRKTLNELQRFSSFGKIDGNVLNQITDIRNFHELQKSMKEKNFTDMRKWVVSNLDVDSTFLIRKIYDSFSDSLKPDSIPQAILILAKYQYQAAFVADPEINLVACLTELMVDCEFK